MDNLTVVAKINETSKVISILLKETNSSNALVAKDLTGYTGMVMQVEAPHASGGGTVIMNAVPCVIDAAPTTGKITCTTDFTVALHPNMAAGTYNLEFSGLNAAGKRRYWPLDKNSARTFGKMIIQNPLA